MQAHFANNRHVLGKRQTFEIIKIFGQLLQHHLVQNRYKYKNMYKYKYTGKIMAPSWTITALPSIAKQPSTCVNIDGSCTAVDLFTGQVSLFCWQQIIALSANRDGVVTGQGLTWKLGNCQNFQQHNLILWQNSGVDADNHDTAVTKNSKGEEHASLHGLPNLKLFLPSLNSTPPWERTFGHFETSWLHFGNFFQIVLKLFLVQMKGAKIYHTLDRGIKLPENNLTMVFE